MIYDLIMLSQPAKGSIRSFQYQESVGIQRSNLDSYHRNLPASLSLPGFCTANRQIYYEMEHLLHTNPARLTLLHDETLNRDADVVSLGPLVEQYPWIQQNTKELRLPLISGGLNLALCEKLFSEREDYWMPYLSNCIYSEEEKASIGNMWRAMFWLCCCSNDQPQTTATLQATALFFSSFHRLETVELLWNNHGTISNSENFWDNLNALAARVECSIVVFKEDDVVDVFRFAQQHGGQLLIKSTWQYGEQVFGEGHAVSKTWRRDGLYSRIRWESAFRIVSPDGCLSVPVVVRDVKAYFD